MLNSEKIINTNKNEKKVSMKYSSITLALSVTSSPENF